MMKPVGMRFLSDIGVQYGWIRFFYRTEYMAAFTLSCYVFRLFFMVFVFLLCYTELIIIYFSVL